MRIRQWIWSSIVIGLMAGMVQAESVRERVLQSYAAVSNLSCEIRRDSPLPDGETLRMLSRVYYQRPDQLHVERFSPVKRRIVCDGTVFRSYTEGLPKGFSKPVAELDAEMIRNLRMVPGSFANMLEMLDGAKEVLLEGTETYPVRAGYDNGKSFSVLSLDEQGRLARFEVFSTPAMTDLSTFTAFSAFQEILPGTWLPCHHQTRAVLDGVERMQITRIDNVVANGKLPASLFVADAFFPGVEFVDAFEKMME